MLAAVRWVVRRVHSRLRSGESVIYIFFPLSICFCHLPFGIELHFFYFAGETEDDTVVNEISHDWVRNCRVQQVEMTRRCMRKCKWEKNYRRVKDLRTANSSPVLDLCVPFTNHGSLLRSRVRVCRRGRKGMEYIASAHRFTTSNWINASQKRNVWQKKLCDSPHSGRTADLYRPHDTNRKSIHFYDYE